MKELKKRIHDEKNGLNYVLVGDYYVPDDGGEKERRPIGKWGSMHRDYLETMDRRVYIQLILKGRLNDYLATINEQATLRFDVVMRQMMETEGVTEELKRKDQMAWIRSINSIITRTEEIVKEEMIYC